MTEGGIAPNAERLCVVILNWNTSKHVERCVAGLVHMPHVDLLMVDNHSCDADYEYLVAVAEECGASIVRTNDNLGYAGGMNAGMRAAQNAGYTYALLLNGDTLPGRAVADGSFFAQTQNTRRLDSGLVAETPLSDTTNIHLRASAMRQNHLHGFGSIVEDDRHTSLFGEVSTSGSSGVLKPVKSRSRL